MRPAVPRRSRRSRRVLAGTASAAAVVLLVTAAGPALAAPPVDTNANNNTSEKLRRAGATPYTLEEPQMAALIGRVAQYGMSKLAISMAVE